MNPFPNQNSVLVMDNCSIHKSLRTYEILAAYGVKLMFLPAYSPDLNPVIFYIHLFTFFI
jgi:transposase